jgi:L-fuconolactonase
VIPTIDAHHHLWRYREPEYRWIGPDMGVLRRDFLIDDLESLCREHDVAATVAVQARQSLKETDWLLSCAAGSETIAGVVGWVPLVSDGLRGDLEARVGEGSRLVGVRHVVQDEPDPEFLLSREFNRGVKLLREYGLVYDVLVYERQLPAVLSFIDRHPDQVFVIDHCAKPRITEGALEPWGGYLREVARRPQVFCKVSGLITEAGPEWKPFTLRPFLDCVVEAFGTHRLMFGSDWPVCLICGDYGRWLQTARDYFAPFSPDEQQRVFAQTASAVYGLDAS